MDGRGLSLWKMPLRYNGRVLIRSRPEGREMHWGPCRYPHCNENLVPIAQALRTQVIANT